MELPQPLSHHGQLLMRAFKVRGFVFRGKQVIPGGVPMQGQCHMAPCPDYPRLGNTASARAFTVLEVVDNQVGMIDNKV